VVVALLTMNVVKTNWQLTSHKPVTDLATASSKLFNDLLGTSDSLGWLTAGVLDDLLAAAAKAAAGGVDDERAFGGCDESGCWDEPDWAGMACLVLGTAAPTASELGAFRPDRTETDAACITIGFRL